MRLNQRGSLSTRLPSATWRKRFRHRKSTYLILFALTLVAGIILLTREYALFKLGAGPCVAAIYFLVALSWLAAGTLHRKTNAVQVAIFMMNFGFVCFALGRDWRSTEADKMGKIQTQRLKSLARATELYAEDHSEKLPLANVWMDSISDRVKEADFNLGTTLVPPIPGYHVAMNSDLSGKSLAGLESKNRFCLFFISHKSERNANDALHSITEDRLGVSISGFVRPFSEAVSPNEPRSLPSSISK